MTIVTPVPLPADLSIKSKTIKPFGKEVELAIEWAAKGDPKPFFTCTHAPTAEDCETVELWSSMLDQIAIFRKERASCVSPP